MSAPVPPLIPWPAVGSSRYVHDTTHGGYTETVIGHQKHPTFSAPGVLYTWWQKGKTWLLIRVKKAP